jgi:hypothetical protein
MEALAHEQPLVRKIPRSAFFERVEMSRQILMYVLPVGILLIASIVMTLPFVNLPGFIRQIPGLLLILSGIIIAVSGIAKSIVKNSPRTLSGYIERRELYGIVAALIGWMQVWIIHLNSRIDQILLLLQQR